MPAPPLDGSKILFGLLTERYAHIEEWFQRNSIFILLIVIFFIWSYLQPVIELGFSFLTGIGLR
jgi:membrane-associated protease RseP (regulator of RpoE activity)